MVALIDPINGLPPHAGWKRWKDIAVRMDNAVVLHESRKDSRYFQRSDILLLFTTQTPVCLQGSLLTFVSACDMCRLEQWSLLSCSLVVLARTSMSLRVYCVWFSMGCHWCCRWKFPVTVISFRQIITSNKTHCLQKSLVSAIKYYKPLYDIGGVSNAAY